MDAFATAIASSATGLLPQTDKHTAAAVNAAMLLLQPDNVKYIVIPFAL
jgi:hypothetical protein